MVTGGREDGSAERLQRDYRPAFLRYLARRDESARHAGYLLGRAAVDGGRGMLDLVAAHHVTLAEVLPDARSADEVLTMTTAASEFLTEVLASFAMASAAVAALQEQLLAVEAELAELRRPAGRPSTAREGSPPEHA